METKKEYQYLHWLDFGIFPATVLFAIGFQYDDMIATLKKKKANLWADAISDDKELIDSDKYFALKRQSKDIKTGKIVTYFYIIMKGSFKFTDYEMCVLAHECLHICQFFLRDVLDRDKEIEAEAYLHTHLMSSILKIMREPFLKQAKK